MFGLIWGQTKKCDFEMHMLTVHTVPPNTDSRFIFIVRLTLKLYFLFSYNLNLARKEYIFFYSPTKPTRLIYKFFLKMN